MNSENQASFEGWARVEVMGHQTHIGFVRTEAYGQAVMFRVDSPGAAAREYILESPEYIDGTWTPAGATVKRAAREGVTVMVGASSIYRMVPCTEAAALKLIEQAGRAELKLVSLPEGRALPSPGEDQEDDEGIDPREEV